MCEDTEEMQRSNTSKKGQGREGDNHRHSNGKQQGRWGSRSTALLRHTYDGCGCRQREKWERMGESLLGCRLRAL